MLCPHVHDVDVIQLHTYLQEAVIHGARAARLLQYVPGIVELLYPAQKYPDLSEHDRALRVQHDIRHVIDTDIGGHPGEALATVLCLRPGTVGRKLGDRRRIAGEHLDMDGGTYRRPHHEGALLLDLAIEMRNYYTTRTETDED